MADPILSAEALAVATLPWTDDGVWVSLERVVDVADQKQTPPAMVRSSCGPGVTDSYWVAELRVQPDGTDSAPAAVGLGPTPAAALDSLMRGIAYMAKEKRDKLTAAIAEADCG